MPLPHPRQTATALVVCALTLVVGAPASLVLSAHAQMPPPAVEAEAPDPPAPPDIPAPPPGPPGGNAPAPLPFGFSSSSASTLSTVSSWIEDAENGLTNVIDGTDPGYSLLQSAHVGQGQYAFRLAHQTASPNRVTVNQPVLADSDTKLSFQGKQSWSGTGQIAKVQVSTDNGATWPNTLYQQAGTGGEGDTTFQQKEFSLASFAGQTILVRFSYEYTGGSAYDTSYSQVGWFIDNIQIGAAIQKTLYSVGNPSDDAQLYLEFINRARANSSVEANWLKNLTDPDVLGSYSYYRINTSHIVSQFANYVSYGFISQVSQPLSFNEKLLAASQCHTQDLYNNMFQGHNTSSNPPNCNGLQFPAGSSMGDRADFVGFNWQNIAENVYSYADSTIHGHAGFNVDWGNTTNTSSPYYLSAHAGQGMQNPAGHRRNIHNNTFKEIGIGVINGSRGSVGPQLVTQDFGKTFEDPIFITGCVFDDLNGNNFFDPGEGRPGIRVDVEGSAYYAVSTSSGAYSVPVDGNGAHDVSFTGTDIQTWSTQVTVFGRQNVKVDHNPVTALSYSSWAAALGITGGENGDDDLDGVKNFAEFALAGMDPTVVDPHLFPAAEFVDGKLRMTVNKRPGITGVVYEIHLSTDLQNWSVVGTTVETDDATTLIVSTPLTGPQKFLCLLIATP